MAELYDEEHLHAADQLSKLTEQTMAAYKAWQKEVFKPTTLDGKTKELIGLAAGCALQCSYCIDSHAKKAKAKGATDAEIAETIQIAAQIRAGAALAYGVQAFKGQK